MAQFHKAVGFWYPATPMMYVCVCFQTLLATSASRKAAKKKKKKAVKAINEEVADVLPSAPAPAAPPATAVKS